MLGMEATMNGRVVSPWRQPTACRGEDEIGKGHCLAPREEIGSGP
jgi:hypothetical protein